MSQATESSAFRVTVAGAHGHGRQEVLEAICTRLGGSLHSKRVGDLLLWEGELPIEPPADANRLLIDCLDDGCSYAAGQDLLVRRADAVIFVFDVRHESLEAGWLALQRVAESAQRGGYDLRSRPLVLQYHRCDAHPGFEPGKMDGWLGLPPGEAVSRVVTSAGRPDGDGAVFDALWRQLAVGATEQ